MKCPIDNAELKMTERQGIEIDYCPQCRGVWLDRGELDKIIERSSQELAPPPVQQPASVVAGDYPRTDQYDRRREEYFKHKRRKSLLGEIFDF
jgi:Zn-finger nucleic acid-binding protein